MNWTQVKTNWKDVRDEVHAQWGKLSEADLNSIGGSREELVKKLQQRYSMEKSKAETEADMFIKKLKN
jgi:uncharacterized protein YjbJ (UPF0337 family)